MYEQLAAEFLTEQQVVAYRDDCDLLDHFSDGALADQLVTASAGRLRELNFARLVEALGRLRIE